MKKRPIEIDDLLRIRFPHDAALSPDGAWCVFALGRLDYEANEIRANLWIISTEGGEPVPLTADEGRDSTPVWSVDGRWIAFLSDRSGRQRGDGRRDRKRPPMQLWIIPAQGGEPRQLTFFKAGVSQPAWSPDGRTLAFVTRGTLDRLEDAEDEVIVREIRRPKFKFDGMGFLEDYAHIWTVPAAGGPPVQLTDGDYDHEFPLWLPAGREVVGVSNRTPDADLSLIRDLWAVDVSTRTPRQITHHRGPCHSPTASPDGRWIAFVGHDLHALSATNMGVWVVPSSGGEAVHLTAEFDRSVGNAVGSDARIAPLFPPVAWIGDSDVIVFLATDASRTHLYRVDVADRTIRALTDGGEVIADLTAAGGRIVYQRMTTTSLDELWLLSPAGDPRRLTSVNDALMETLEVGKPERFTYKGVDDWPMEGWILKPPDVDPAGGSPAILRIHGGPHATYGDTFVHYVQVLAARGYVIVWTNPRGSQGYGETFTRAVVGDWGGKDSQDILLGLDHAITQGVIDPLRVAVTGGSYGGFMTNWLITHTDRFRCAATEVCVSNLYSFYGTSDIGATWGELEWGANPWDDPETLLEHSPLAYAKNVTTPVLIIANEDDHRCPMEQSEQFFITLRKLGKEAEFLRFPGESHMMSSAGRPKPRIERLRRLVAWFDRHLLAAESRPEIEAVRAT